MKASKADLRKEIEELRKIGGVLRSISERYAQENPDAILLPTYIEKWDAIQRRES